MNFAEAREIAASALARGALKLPVTPPEDHDKTYHREYMRRQRKALRDAGLTAGGKVRAK